MSFLSEQAEQFKGQIFGRPSKGERRETSVSTTTPVLFGPSQLRTPTRTRALQQVTPSLVESGLAGPDPAERQRLKTTAFEDIGISTKSALENLREIFGRTGVRGGVQGADVSDILEASIGAKGAAATNIEDILKGDVQRKLQNLLALLTSPEPFAVSAKQRAERTGFGTDVGAQRGLADFINVSAAL